MSCGQLGHIILVMILYFLCLFFSPFKDKFNTKTDSTKTEFLLVLGLIGVITTNFVLKHLSSQHIDTGISIV